jgi:1-acyl-sn-glycerol-3-phosphate acyltransferase
MVAQAAQDKKNLRNTMKSFVETVFSDKFLTGDAYRSAELAAGVFSKFFPSLSFYARLLAGPVLWLSARAANGRCDAAAWVHASVWVTELMESLGCPIEVQGMDAIAAEPGPCLFVANHMSTLETFMLPGIIRPRRPMTFVVKKSLTTMPFFGAIMRSRDPVVVNRLNPREDLTAVLEGGVERLNKGVSLVIFPQSTRSRLFDARQFNSIGVKLARRAGAPIVPLALKTDAWGQGRKIKEYGKINPRLPVRYRFAAPVRVEGQGKTEHAAICDYIERTLAAWQTEDGVNN